MGDSVYRKGDLVWYRQRDGTYEEAQVLQRSWHFKHCKLCRSLTASLALQPALALAGSLAGLRRVVTVVGGLC